MTTTVDWAALAKAAPVYKQIPAWVPEKAGDSLVGTLVKVDQRHPNNGYAPYPVLTLLDEDGEEHAVHAYHHVLLDQLRAVAPDIGDVVRIFYGGKAEGSSGRPYHRYTVTVRRAEAS